MPDLNVAAAVIGVVVGAFSGILFNFFYRNCSSDYVTGPSSEYYGEFR